MSEQGIHPAVSWSTAVSSRRLDEVSRVDLGFPMDFLATDFVQHLIHGETLPLLDARPRRHP